ncbi:hypothetical protein Q5P01_017641 [Channa striata]|uniref:Uncharacterized protein n=1 Tax=Channa striata TaxID=64152 RepID=A0AA88SHL4_CHASR|nr:hypothetical protein Q5P01_017641 [Channa striata]
MTHAATYESKEGSLPRYGIHSSTNARRLHILLPVSESQLSTSSLPHFLHLLLALGPYMAAAGSQSLWSRQPIQTASVREGWELQTEMDRIAPHRTMQPHYRQKSRCGNATKQSTCKDHSVTQGHRVQAAALKLFAGGKHAGWALGYYAEK